MTSYHTLNVYLVKPDLLVQMDQLLTMSSLPYVMMDQALRQTWRELFEHHVIPSGPYLVGSEARCSVGLSTRRGVLRDWIVSAASVNDLFLLKRFANWHAVYLPEQLAQLQQEVQLLCTYPAWDNAEIYNWDDIHFFEGQNEACQFSTKGVLFTPEADSYDEDNQPRDLFIFLFRLQELLKTARAHGLGVLYFSWNYA